MITARALAVLCFILLPSSFSLSIAAPFVVTVIDDATGRGVPLVELTAVNHVKFVTDSAGLAAVDEPGMMNQKFYFHVKGHGYEYPKDGFGFAGVALDVKPGGIATVKVKRLNIAQRLYRTTGEGIYRDTLLAGRTPPTANPVLNGKVLGQDSTQRAIYKNKIHWFWGDTNQAAYPLGHFGMSGAVSDLPSSGGLNPDVGVDYRYFTDPKTGFARPMVPGENLRWTDGHFVLKDPEGRERMIAKLEILKGLTEPLGRKIVVYNDETDQFDELKKLAKDEPLCPLGHPFHHADAGVNYVYFPFPWGTLRVKDDWNAVLTPDQYEGFTCLAPNTRYSKDKPQIDRTSDGKVVWAWKRNTPPVTPAEQADLVKAGHLKPAELWNALIDADTKQPVQAHAGSTNWNPFRKKWVLITTQIYGKPSMLGEIYYAEADAPHGPFKAAKKIITHDKYTFYNPVHHPFFDADGGRVIYLEGTYTRDFSGNDVPTPRYDYNLIMYKLDLADPRLKM